MQLLPYTPQTKDLPMPLTDVDQSGFDWHKHPHTKILLNARIRALKPAHKGMLWMLMEHAALEVPFASLPNDVERLAEMAGVTLAIWQKSSGQVLGAAFELCQDNRWYCKLLVDNLAQQVKQADQDTTPSKPKKPVSPEVSEARRQAGLKGKQAQMAKQANADVCQNADLANFGKTLANAEFCQNDALAKSGKSLANEGDIGGELDSELDRDKDLNQNLKNIRAASQHTKDAIAKKFDVFWAAYPKKTDRKKALVAFGKINPSDDLLQTMLAAIAAWSPKWIADPQYTPHPTTWLNGERWTDAPPPVAVAKTSQKPLSGAVNQNWPDSQYTIPPSPETLAAIKKMQDEMEDGL